MLKKGHLKTTEPYKCIGYAKQVQNTAWNINNDREHIHKKAQVEQQFQCYSKWGQNISTTMEIPLCNIIVFQIIPLLCIVQDMLYNHSDHAHLIWGDYKAKHWKDRKFCIKNNVSHNDILAGNYIISSLILDLNS